MAVFAIPNQKKTTQVDFPIEKVKISVKNISLLNKKYKFTNSNEIFNQYTYEATEFLSMGVYIDINLNTITENKTEITVEVRRKIGTFNESYEVTNANQHLVNIYDCIAKLTTKTNEEIEALHKEIADSKLPKPKPVKPTKVIEESSIKIEKEKRKIEIVKSDINANFTTTLLLCFFLGLFGIHRFYTKNYFMGFIQLITLGCFGVWTLIDFILILTGAYKDGEGNLLRK